MARFAGLSGRRGQTDEGGVMALPLLLALQAAAAAPPAEIVVTPIRFDLADVRRPDLDRAATEAPACDRSDPDSIVVCGRRPAVPGYQIERWERIFALDPIRAEMRLPGNMIGSVNVEQEVLLRGEVSNRLLLRVRVPF